MSDRMWILFLGHPAHVPQFKARCPQCKDRLIDLRPLTNPEAVALKELLRRFRFSIAQGDLQKHLDPPSSSNKSCNPLRPRLEGQVANGGLRLRRCRTDRCNQ